MDTPYTVTEPEDEVAISAELIRVSSTPQDNNQVQARDGRDALSNVFTGLVGFTLCLQ